MELVFAKIGNVGKQGGRVVVQRTASYDPAHMRPKTAILRRMRIAFHVSILVMHAVCRDPEKRAAFQRQRGTEGQEIFHPLIGFKSAMREQTVIRDTNSQAAGNPPQEHGDKKRLPCKHKKRGHCADVKCDHEKRGEFADWLSKGPITLEKIHECIFSLLARAAFSFDSSLSAMARTDCNTCVICAPEGQHGKQWFMA
jgi:hypothetical protein